MEGKSRVETMERIVMSRAILFAGVAALIIGAAGTASAVEKVRVCHFPGHLSRTEVPGRPGQCARDFIVKAAAGETFCSNLGGDIIEVALPAAENGHRVCDKNEPCGTPPGHFSDCTNP
jgi:hypothetical protein